MMKQQCGQANQRGGDTRCAIPQQLNTSTVQLLREIDRWQVR